MNEAIKEVAAQNLILGSILVLLVPLITISPSLLKAIREGRSPRALLNEMAEAQEASTKFKEGNNNSLLDSSQEYLKAILHPKFRKRIEYKIDRQVNQRMPRRYRLSPHRVILTVLMTTYVTTTAVVYGGILIYAAVRDSDIPLFATPLVPLLGTAVMFLVGNHFETKVIPSRYTPQYDFHKVKALEEFNQEHDLSFPLLILNGPGFDRYIKQPDGSYRAVKRGTQKVPAATPSAPARQRGQS